MNSRLSLLDAPPKKNTLEQDVVGSEVEEEEAAPYLNSFRIAAAAADTLEIELSNEHNEGASVMSFEESLANFPPKFRSLIRFALGLSPKYRFQFHFQRYSRGMFTRNLLLQTRK